jgi:hypothetical protein
MVDRQKLETILVHLFPGAGLDQIAAAANAIMGLDDGREAPSRDRRDSGSGSRSESKGHGATAARHLPSGPA